MRNTQHPSDTSDCYSNDVHTARAVTGEPGLQWHNTIRYGVYGSLILLLSGCSVFGIKPPPVPAYTVSGVPIITPGQRHNLDPGQAHWLDRAIIDNLAGVIEQVFYPISTTVQLSRSHNTPSLAYLGATLAQKGYGIQRVSADQGASLATYERTALSKDDNDSSEPAIKARITIGAIDIAREYTRVDGGSVTPSGPVTLSGTRTAITVNDEPQQALVITDPQHSDVQYVANLDFSEQAPIISLLSNDRVNRIAEQNALTTSRQAVNSSRVEINNLFYAGQSSFSSVLDDYKRVDQQLVVFGNDSMVLGDTNKQLIAQLVQTRLTDQDLISLVGCSNGPTALDIGNEGLALGRAQRVTEALLNQGIARERILDEGCWAPVSAGEKFPSRGVVMEIWRKQS